MYMKFVETNKYTKYAAHAGTKPLWIAQTNVEVPARNISYLGAQTPCPDVGREKRAEGQPASLVLVLLSMLLLLLLLLSLLPLLLLL